MKTLGEILQLIVQSFKDKRIPRARRVAEDLLSHVLNLPRLELYLQFDKPLMQEELTLLRELMKRALKEEPIEYLLGKVVFYNCTLRVTQDVLIPRPETEILLDKACNILKSVSRNTKNAWDLCTGSGCLGIGLKKTFPELHVCLADLSDKALAVAQQNAMSNGALVECLKGDLLAAFEGRKTDILLCNPPYVSNKEYLALDKSVRAYEPKEAFLGGEDGLFFYKRLSAELPEFLNPGAFLFFEIGSGQGQAVQNLFLAPWWRRARVERDFAGHERFFFLEFE